ncbi:hypothetical protein JOB18_034854 [Solea senegalensis]|uniref:Uncharacterized protein n=1 Tax=Solea senegalensis TaxID=28829 RepID=A0AAV6QAD6_SOLSE|nr:hypothetical protein JOB18_034854 [Solea senegalensis]
MSEHSVSEWSEGLTCFKHRDVKGNNKLDSSSVTTTRQLLLRLNCTQEIRSAHDGRLLLQKILFQEKEEVASEKSLESTEGGAAQQETQQEECGAQTELR